MERRCALVTSASVGLGPEFARLLAADGLDVAFVARSGAGLEELAQELEERYAVSTCVIQHDLARVGSAREVAAALRDYRVADVDVLINNAVPARSGAFVDLDYRQIVEQMQAGVLTMTELTRFFLPGMVRRGWGRVLNVSSIAAFQPGPLAAVHHATSAYVLSLSLALAEEVKGTGVTVTAMCPPPAATGPPTVGSMDELGRTGGSRASDADEIARAGYEAMKRGKPLLVEGGGNRVRALGARLMPRTTAAASARRVRGRRPR